jgi:hypothetical protein
VPVTENDILANVPFVEGCGMWFDHHSSEEERLGGKYEYKGAHKNLPSAARVIWEYFGGHERFPGDFDEMLDAVDRSDAAQWTLDDIENPQGWTLLSFVMDPRTGLGRYKDYRISNYRLMEDLIEYCRAMPVERILELPDVKERVTRYFAQQNKFVDMLRENSSVHGKVVAIELRHVDEIFCGNRFTVYTMFPETNISIHVLWGLNRKNVALTMGKSIINRSGNIDVGKLMLRYGGGGHSAVGTCQVPTETADRVLQELIEEVNAHYASQAA